MKIFKFERSSFLAALALAAMAFSGCSSSSGVEGRERDIQALTELCHALQHATIYGAPRDAIPALTDPPLVAATDDEADYLLPTDRVIGLNLPSGFLAVPHNILWWHEIVNLTDSNLAVTYCPLTGSSMVFHRAAVDGANFGVSGLLFNNNLIMFDRKEFLGEPTTLWPQMLAAGRCGPLEPKALTMFPVIEIEWGDWVELHPDTRVVSKRTGISRLYRADLYPYGDYEVEDNASFLYPVSNLDLRRPPKERVLGIPDGEGGGIAFPFGVLRDLGDIAAKEKEIASAKKALTKTTAALGQLKANKLTLIVEQTFIPMQGTEEVDTDPRVVSSKLINLADDDLRKWLNSALWESQNAAHLDNVKGVLTVLKLTITLQEALPKPVKADAFDGIYYRSPIQAEVVVYARLPADPSLGHAL
ncbi:MAG: DUF3179 domain-containing protein, partial [Gemmatimonadetes bacterium]|nr:DUF3179 domain-containing protein [Gemmatimonadota bacterium]